MKFKHFTFFVCAIFLSIAQAQNIQSWNYKGYSQTTGNYISEGSITLEQGDAGATLSIMLSDRAPCSRLPVKAVVFQDHRTLTIVAEPLFNGCDKARFIIKKDGSGGVREVLSADGLWVPDGLDRKLTPIY